tara:strand:+ start:478 stop:648 length:171 start_codon:yes stop_codon:yes gene_type:complete
MNKSESRRRFFARLTRASMREPTKTSAMGTVPSAFWDMLNTMSMNMAMDRLNSILR